jgi:hypothetical protein
VKWRLRREREKKYAAGFPSATTLLDDRLSSPLIDFAEEYPYIDEPEADGLE